MEEELRKMLNEGDVLVTFTKVDGTLREMLCTTNPDLIPPEALVQSENIRPKPPGVIAVWDLEKKAWRSFRVDSVQKQSIPLICLK